MKKEGKCDICGKETTVHFYQGVWSCVDCWVAHWGKKSRRNDDFKRYI